MSPEHKNELIFKDLEVYIGEKLRSVRVAYPPGDYTDSDISIFLQRRYESLEETLRKVSGEIGAHGSHGTRRSTREIEQIRGNWRRQKRQIISMIEIFRDKRKGVIKIITDYKGDMAGISESEDKKT